MAKSPGCSDKSSARRFYDLLPEVGKDKKGNAEQHRRLQDLLNRDDVNLFHRETESLNTTLHMAVLFQLGDGFDRLVDILKRERGDILDMKNSVRYTALHLAAEGNRPEHTATLIEKGADTNAVGDHAEMNETPLHLAARFQSDECMRLLLESQGTNVDLQNDLGQTPLHVAASANSGECVRLLLERGARKDIRDAHSFTPLLVAVLEDSPDAFHLLYKATGSKRITTDWKWNALHIAAYRNHHGIVRELILDCPDLIDGRNRKGETALHLAVKIKSDKTESVTQLVTRKGVQIDARDKEDQTPLHVAVKRGNLTCVSLLLEHGARPDNMTKDKESPLHMALLYKDIYMSQQQINERSYRLAELLLNKNAGILKDSKQRTAFHLAAQYDHLKLVNELLHVGADINDGDEQGFTPLHLATILGRYDFLEALLSKGKDKLKVDAQDNAGRTALYFSVVLKDLDSVKLLVARGAKADCGNVNHVTPLHQAARSNNKYLMEALLGGGEQRAVVDVEVEDAEGWRPVHVAAVEGAHLCLEQLLKFGADRNAQLTRLKKTPLELATQGNHDQCAALLMCNENGEPINGCMETETRNGCIDKERGKENGTKKRVGNTEMDAVPFTSPHMELDSEETLLSAVQSGAGPGKEGRTSQAIGETAVSRSCPRMLLQEGTTCESRLEMDERCLKKTDARGDTCLHEEARLGHAHHLGGLIARGAEPGRQNRRNRTALHEAAAGGAEDCLLVLLEARASVMCVDVDNNTPLHLASSSGHAGCVRRLLVDGKPPLRYLDKKNKNGETPVHVASLNGHRNCLAELLDALSDEEARNALKVRTSADSTALLLAAQGNHVQCFELLFVKGSDVMIRDSKKRLVVFGEVLKKDAEEMLKCVIGNVKNDGSILQKLLFEAVTYGSSKCLKVLLENGAQVSAKNEQNMTPMEVAMDRNRVECVRTMLPTLLDDDDEAKRDLLHYAARNGYEHSLHTVADHVTDLTAEIADGMTVLHVAALYGRDGCVKVALDKGVHVDLRDSNDRHAIHYASKQGHLSCLRCLLGAGAEASPRDARQMTPLHLAARWGHTECLSLLLEQKQTEVDGLTEESWTPLHFCAKKGILEGVQLLVDSGADVNAVTQRQYTPLRFAVRNDHRGIVQYLVSCRDVDINMQDSQTNGTMLHFAVKMRRTECLRILLEGGADVNVKDSKNRTALHWAVTKRDTTCVELLLGRDSVIVDSVDDKDFTALLTACRFNYTEISRLLLDAGAKVNVKADRTALHYAVIKKNVEMVRLLLARGADVGMCDDRGKTPLEEADKDGQEEIAALLRAARDMSA